MIKKISRIILVLLSLYMPARSQQVKNLFEFDESSSPRWSSPENRNGVKGNGAQENFGAKGRPHIEIPAGQAVDLLNIQGQGIVNRIWLTISDLSPKTLRALTVQIYWDNETTPAVQVPLADFFGMGLARMTSFKNNLFANPEGKSFNCFIPMPFKKAAKIQIKNDASYKISSIFFDVDYQLLKTWNTNNLYFHAYWHRDTVTTLGKDFELLPLVKGRGRLLGVNIGINTNPLYKSIWWGEGEVKVYLDGDKEYPTLVGTGTEDYIGDAWSQKTFYNDYTGSLVADETKLQWSFYRYHIIDPIYFSTDCHMTIQQMGSSFTRDVIAAQKGGAPMIPTSTEDGKGGITPIYKKGITFTDPSIKDQFALFYRTDDVSATAYYYLDKPAGDMPSLQPLNIRTYNLKADQK